MCSVQFYPMGGIAVKMELSGSSTSLEIVQPFSRNFISYGEPFPIGSELSEEAALTKIAAAINKITEEVDNIAGIRPPV